MKMQIKTPIRYHYTPFRRLISKQTCTPASTLLGVYTSDWKTYVTSKLACEHLHSFIHNHENLDATNIFFSR
jgi:hypothetical protein